MMTEEYKNYRNNVLKAREAEERKEKLMIALKIVAVLAVPLFIMLRYAFYMDYVTLCL